MAVLEGSPSIFYVLVNGTNIYRVPQNGKGGVIILDLSLSLSQTPCIEHKHLRTFWTLQNGLHWDPREYYQLANNQVT